jgi:hypothetical protein
VALPFRLCMVKFENDDVVFTAVYAGVSRQVVSDECSVSLLEAMCRFSQLLKPGGG